MANAIRNVLVAIGTRPEAIKMAPVVLALRRQPWVKLRVLATAQHREMLDQVLQSFGIAPDIDFDVMRENQRLAGLTARLLEKMDVVLEVERPDVVLAQGDTTTVFATALACFYRNVPFGHVEAGLRTGSMADPFPEEMNRVVVGRMARWHFAPTERARQNLLAERAPQAHVHVTGNTVIDALEQVSAGIPAAARDPSEPRLILVTAHRRENFGAPLESILRALRTLADQRADVRILYPVHPNPHVAPVVRRMLGGHPGITLCEPLGYVPFIAAMKQSFLILSDSGGVQEEAPALAKPVLVLRNETERPEAVEAGVARLVGTDESAILAEVTRLLDDAEAYRCMARGGSPYGDGHAAQRIVDILRRDLLD